MISKPPAKPEAAAGVREIDLTWWLATAGLAVFLLMLVGAVVVYAVSQTALFDATATAALAVAPTEPPSATPTTEPSDTPSPTPLGGLVLADTATRPPPTPSPTRTLTPTISPTPTITLTPTRPPPTPSPTRVGTPTPVVYTVRDGDTLGAIAQVYGLSIEELVEANRDIDNPDQLSVGQTLVIPLAASQAPAATAGAATAATGQATPGEAGPLPAVLEGDLAAAYPLTLEGPRVTIHYQQDMFADPPAAEAALDSAEDALASVERTLDVAYPGRIDLYLAGSLFAQPNQLVRQRHFPAQRRAFLLFDSSGSPAERRSMLANEITHIVAWHTYGVPASAMLAEGLASYAGRPYLEEGGFIGFRDFCRSLARTNRLPSLNVIENSIQGFLDPVRSLYNYRAAACFVDYLIDQRGAEVFSQLYSTGNYLGLYGSALVSLDANFGLEMNTGAFQIGFDPERLGAYYDEVNAGYGTLFSQPELDQTAYETLDDARIATLTGNFDGARALLDQFHQLVR